MQLTKEIQRCASSICFLADIFSISSKHKIEFKLQTKCEFNIQMKLFSNNFFNAVMLVIKVELFNLNTSISFQIIDFTK